MESKNNSLFVNIGRAFVPKQYHNKPDHIPIISTDKISNPYFPTIKVDNTTVISLPNETYFTPLVRVNGIYTTIN